MEDAKKKTVDNPKYLPAKVRRDIRNKAIIALSKKGYSITEICTHMATLGESISRTTVFFALNGRWSKKAAERRKVRNSLKNKPNK